MGGNPEQAKGARFEDAARSSSERGGEKGIGTLGEKGLHAALKRYYEPRSEFREVRIAGYVADVAREGEIYEIQTKGLYRLAPKLEAFLGTGARVTVVYPVARTKWIQWHNPHTGEAVSRRKSPKAGRPSDALSELYGIRALIARPNLRVVLAMVEVEERKWLNGWGEGKKKGAEKFECAPLALCEEIVLECPGDCLALLPQGIGERFTAAEFARCLKLRGRPAWQALALLRFLGAAEPVGKRSRAVEYAARWPMGPLRA